MTDSFEDATCPNCGREQERRHIQKCGTCGEYYCGNLGVGPSLNSKCLNKKEITYEYLDDELTSATATTSSTYIQCPRCDTWGLAVVNGGVEPLKSDAFRGDTPREDAKKWAREHTKVDGEYQILSVEKK